MTANSIQFKAHQYIQIAGQQKKLGLLKDAEQSYQEALELSPNNVVALYNLANLQKLQGRQEEAKHSYQLALKVAPNAFEVHFNLGNLLKVQNDLVGAAFHYQKATHIKPDFALAYSCLGLTYAEMKRVNEAESAHQTALRLAPNSLPVLCNLSESFFEFGQYTEAKNTLVQVLRSNPSMPQAIYIMGLVQHALGNVDDAIIAFEKCIQLEYSVQSVLCTLLFTLASQAKVTSKYFLNTAKQYEKYVLKSMQHSDVGLTKFSRRSRVSGRKLRIGYLSSDFRAHAVSNFSEPLFANHDKTRIQLIAYSASNIEDDLTIKFRQYCDEWVSITGLSDEQACARIREDEIDVLIDLMGSTRGNRLGIFVLRAAPIQVHYLGYFASTGISQMDYWIADEVLAPPSCQSMYVEQLWRLPRSWMAYRGQENAPLPNWAPEQQNGIVWLGSFNNLAKITPETLILWANILTRIPHCKLMLKTSALKYEDNQERIREFLVERGVAPHQVYLVGSSETWEEHMTMYNQLDIALDPIGGWCGATTSCDALWMGVPVITLAGEWVGQRMTASLVSGLGHPEWIAKNEADYVDKVVGLAADVEYRKCIRGTQRDRMRTSSICDAKSLANALEAAFEGMFDLWWNNPKRLS